MILYHGSKKFMTKIERRQASKSPGLEVPERELDNAVYGSPNYEYALAIGSRPEGITWIDNEKKTIRFEHPELFDPDKTVYVYEIDLKDISDDKIFETEKDRQYSIDVDEAPISKKFVHKARDVEKFYALENWSEEMKREKTDFKIK